MSQQECGTVYNLTKSVHRKNNSDLVYISKNYFEILIQMHCSVRGDIQKMQFGNEGAMDEENTNMDEETRYKQVVTCS